MQLLVIQNNSAFYRLLQRTLLTRPESFDVHYLAFDDVAEVDQRIVQHDIDAVIFVERLHSSADDERIDAFVSGFEKVLSAAQVADIPCLFLSSSQVFEGGQRRFSEADEANNDTKVAKAYQYCESSLANHKQHLILRVSWLYSVEEYNFLANVIAAVKQGNRLQFNSAAKSNPTSLPDIVRVMVALLLQMPYSDNNWGIYHYASADAALGFQFVESIITHAAQFDDSLNAENLQFEHQQDVQSALYFEPVMLDCQKLLNTFGVQQKSWRAQLLQVVRRYYEQ